MAGLGILIAWLGYWVGYYGITQVQGGNWGFLDLGIPGRWTPTVAATPKDSGGNGPPIPPGYTAAQWAAIQANINSTPNPGVPLGQRGTGGGDVGSGSGSGTASTQGVGGYLPPNTNQGAPGSYTP